MTDFHIYRGAEGERIPDEVTRVRVHSSVKVIPDSVFANCRGLKEVQLNEGLEVIGEEAFEDCEDLVKVNFPSTLKVIAADAFNGCTDLYEVSFPQGLKIIGVCAFAGCMQFRNISIPSSVELIGYSAFSYCLGLRSIELAEGLQAIGDYAFHRCDSLFNVYFPSTLSECGENLFLDPADAHDAENTDELVPSPLQRLFPKDDDSELLAEAIKNRFDDLPVHKLCYFQAHESTATTLKKFESLTECEKATCSQGDRFGMTPLHILALSEKPNYFLFMTLMRAFPPELVVAKDVWGNPAIAYLCCRNDYDHVALIKLILQDTVVERSRCFAHQEWKDAVMDELEDFPKGCDNFQDSIAQVEGIYSTLVKYERLEALSLLELLLWKLKIEQAKGEKRSNGRKSRKRVKVDRQGCRINCGADVIICNVLPFLGKLEDFSFIVE